MNFMHKVAVVGDKDSILGFKALGVTIFPVTCDAEASRILTKIVHEKFAVVCVTENVATQIMPQIKEVNKRFLPAVVLIPNNHGALGLGMQQIRENARKAIGIDILFGKEGG